MSMRRTFLLDFVKSNASIGCVGAESNAPMLGISGEPTRPCTSGINCSGAEYGTSIKSSTGELSKVQLCHYFCTPRAAV